MSADKYEELARAIWLGPVFNMPNDVFMARIASALRRTALQARIEGIEWCARQVPTTDGTRIVLDKSLVFQELGRLRAEYYGQPIEGEG